MEKRKIARRRRRASISVRRLIATFLILAMLSTASTSALAFAVTSDDAVGATSLAAEEVYVPEVVEEAPVVEVVEAPAETPEAPVEEAPAEEAPVVDEPATEEAPAVEAPAAEEAPAANDVEAADSDDADAVDVDAEIDPLSALPGTLTVNFAFFGGTMDQLRDALWTGDPGALIPGMPASISFPTAGSDLMVSDDGTFILNAEQVAAGHSWLTNFTPATATTATFGQGMYVGNILDIATGTWTIVAFFATDTTFSIDIVFETVEDDGTDLVWTEFHTLTLDNLAAGTVINEPFIEALMESEGIVAPPGFTGWFVENVIVIGESLNDTVWVVFYESDEWELPFWAEFTFFDDGTVVAGPYTVAFDWVEIFDAIMEGELEALFEDFATTFAGFDLPPGFVVYDVEIVDFCEDTETFTIHVSVEYVGYEPCFVCDLYPCECPVEPTTPTMTLYFYTEGNDGVRVAGPFIFEFDPATPVTAEMIREVMEELGITLPEGYVLVDPLDFVYSVCVETGSVVVVAFAERADTPPPPPGDDSEVAGDTGGKDGDGAGTAGTTDTNRRPVTGPQTGDVVNNFMQLALVAALVATFAIAGLVRTREQN